MSIRNSKKSVTKKGIVSKNVPMKYKYKVYTDKWETKHVVYIAESSYDAKKMHQDFLNNHFDSLDKELKKTTGFGIAFPRPSFAISKMNAVKIL